MKIPEIKILKKVTKNQLRIIYISAIALFIILFFVAFAYAPAGRKLGYLKDKSEKAQAQIAEIMNAVGGRKDMPEAFKELSMRLVEVSSHLTSKDEDVIYALSREAKKLGVEIKNMSPADKNLTQSGIFGYQVEELRLALSLACEFSALGNYLEVLRDKFPYLVKINQLDIKGSGEGKPLLEVELKLSAFLGKKA